jgi:hypothetical protein
MPRPPKKQNKVQSHEQATKSDAQSQLLNSKQIMFMDMMFKSENKKMKLQQEAVEQLHLKNSAMKENAKQRKVQNLFCMIKLYKDDPKEVKLLKDAIKMLMMEEEEEELNLVQMMGMQEDDYDNDNNNAKTI